MLTFVLAGDPAVAEVLRQIADAAVTRIIPRTAEVNGRPERRLLPKLLVEAAPGVAPPMADADVAPARRLQRLLDGSGPSPPAGRVGFIGHVAALTGMLALPFSISRRGTRDEILARFAPGAASGGAAPGSVARPSSGSRGAQTPSTGSAAAAVAASAGRHGGGGAETGNIDDEGAIMEAEVDAMATAEARQVRFCGFAISAASI
jgi:hypothetical protein